MNVPSFCAALVMALPLSYSVAADIVPVSGTQSSTGWVWVVLPPGDPVMDSYSLGSADPLASWSPPDQLLHEVLDEGGRWAEAKVDSSFASTIHVDRVSLITHVSAAALTGDPFSSGAQCEYNQVFHLSFSIDAPTEVKLYAQVGRNTGGWSTPTPFSLRFGREGDSPIIDFAYGGSAENYSEFMPPTSMVLDPGTYTVEANDYNFWGAGRGGQFADFMEFDLQVVPTPVSALPIGIGMLAFSSRRRPH